MKKYYANPIVEVLSLQTNASIAASTISGGELDNDFPAGGDDDI